MIRSRARRLAEISSGIPLLLFGTELSGFACQGYNHTPSINRTQGMPDQKLIRLCDSISKETDPAKMTALLDELIQLLGEKQDAIRAKINANLRKNSLL